MEVENETILFIFLALFAIVIFYLSLKTIEMMYVMRKKRPFYVHFYPLKKKLSEEQKNILNTQFSFYQRLNEKEKLFFEHRAAMFIKDKQFIGQKGTVVTEEMKVLISATAIMLTFGFRDFYIGLIDRILIFPEEFYSSMNNEYHQGEFNPKLKALVLSWPHFKKGFDIENDNLNLGIHEFTHAIHLNSIKERDVSSNIFQDSFKELTNLLTSQEELRDSIIKTKYFRNYAYTNQYEFLAVIIEHFIESPKDLQVQFPQIYSKVRQMLNFNFAGY